MFEMRLLAKSDGKAVLQYRVKEDPDPVNNGLYFKHLVWSEWKNVPVCHEDKQ